VATAGQAPKGKYAVLAEPVDELAGDTEEVGSLSGGDFVLGAEHDHACAVGDVVEHRAHGGLDRGVAAEPLGQVLRVGPDGRVDRVEDGRERAGCHVLHAIRNCNNGNPTPWGPPV